ncbi:MAG: DUF2279 domain-containing protein [Deltaproteobacteria bacterium]|nr:DUF2279 domain-containing protein [Deltaproteobacteria bacterium]
MFKRPNTPPVIVTALLAILLIICPARADAELLHQPDHIADLYVFGLGLGLGVGGAISWKYQENYTGKFTVLREGWFGPDTYAGGADKIGHAYTDYVLLRVIDQIYEDHGFDPKTALLRAFVATTAIRSLMEVADGYTTFKYAPEDLIANVVGALVSASLLKYPAVDEAFGFSWTYLPSREKLDGKVDWPSIDNDYNGSVYHLDARLKGVRRLFNITNSETLDRYILSLNYMTRGYDRERPLKQRIIGLSLGMNASEILDATINKDGSMRVASSLLRYFKLPFTFGGLTYDLDQHKYGVRFGLNYFY